MITQFERYGKQPIHKRMFHEIKDRFRVNKYSNRILNTHGLAGYVPKVTKAKLGIGIIGGGLLISPLVPWGFVLGIPLLRWGIK